MPTGGLISLNHSEHKKLKQTLLARRWCGITNRKDGEYDVKQIGWNYYMNEISAAIGLTQLKKIDRLNNSRKKIAKRYFNEINIEEKMPFDENSVYHFYWILVKNRKKFRKIMDENGIETGIHYKPINEFSMYNSRIKLPNTKNIGKSIVTIPTHPKLTNNDIDKIINLINEFS